MAETQVNTTTAGPQKNPAIASDSSGNYVVAWASYQGGAWGIYAQRYDAAGTPRGGEFQVDSGANPGVTDEMRVAMDSSGNFVVAWYENSSVVAQRFDADGNAQGLQITVAQSGGMWPVTTAVELSSIAADALGNFVVVYAHRVSDYTNMMSPVTKYNVKAQLFDASGAAQGSAFQVNTALDNQADGRVAMAADGSFVVVWRSYGQDGDDYGIYAQRFDSSGNKVDSEFRVNTTTAGGQQYPAIAIAPGGAFVVVWQSSDSSFDGIYAQRYDAFGVAQGGEFRVNTTQAGVQRWPSVAMDSTGRFVVAWTDENGLDGDGRGVFHQWFAADGTPLGSETQISDTSADAQQQPVIAIGTSGTAVFAWQSGSSSSLDVYAASSTAPAAVCFLRGTLILTNRGEVPVEHLCAGDLVVTKFGGLRPIRWIGTQSFHPRFAGPANTPIRFAPGSLGEGIPSCPLHVSPGHAMLLGDVLAHAGALVNGSTITQPPFRGDSIDYFHIDLGPHDCVLANGAWAESYFEDRNRDAFHNAADFHTRFPGHEPMRQQTCLPILTAAHREIAALHACRVPAARAA